MFIVVLKFVPVGFMLDRRKEGEGLALEDSLAPNILYSGFDGGLS